MPIYQSNRSALHRNDATKSTIMGEPYSNCSLVNQDDIRKKLNHLLSKNIRLSIKVPGKFATSTLLTTIDRVENDHVILGGFQNNHFNKDLLMQDTLTVSADFEGIAVSFTLNGTEGMETETAFNLKAPLPQSIEWLQRRNARRVKVPINIPVKVQYKNQIEYFNVADISVTGLSYLDQTENHCFSSAGKLHTDCHIVLPDKSAYPACFEIVNRVTIPCRHTRQVTRVSCEIKRASYRLDTALQHLINQIDFYYQ
jgi:c-di-GMP-binding flagellar brake protein YcgR